MHQRFRVALGATVAAGALALTACSGSPTASVDETPIQIWTPYKAGFEAPMVAAAEACTAAGTPVEVTAFDLSYGELDLKVQAEAQTGTLPDLVVSGLNSIVSLGSNEFVVDLTPLLEGDDTINDEIMPALGVGAIGGAQYIIPWGISIPTVFVNTDIATAAGVDPESLTSWAAIEEAAAKITAAGSYGIAFPNQEGWIPLQFLLTAGTELVDDENRSVFTDDAGDVAIEYVNRLYSSGSAFPGDEGASGEAFLAGEVGLFIGASSYIPSVVAAPFASTTVPFPPVEEGGEVRTGAGGAGIAMFASEERQDVAWDALKCTLEPEILAEYAVGTIGYMPVRTDMDSVLEPGMLDSAPYAAPWSQFDTAGPWLNFPGPNGPRALQLFNEAWLEAAQRSDDPTAVMDETAAEIDELLE